MQLYILVPRQPPPPPLRHMKRVLLRLGAQKTQTSVRSSTLGEYFCGALHNVRKVITLLQYSHLSVRMACTWFIMRACCARFWWSGVGLITCCGIERLAKHKKCVDRNNVTAGFQVKIAKLDLVWCRTHCAVLSHAYCLDWSTICNILYRDKRLMHNKFYRNIMFLLRLTSISLIKCCQ